jgi:hypothetical protein
MIFFEILHFIGIKYTTKDGTHPLSDEDMDEFLISDKFTDTVKDLFC